MFEECELLVRPYLFTLWSMSGLRRLKNLLTSADLTLDSTWPIEVCVCVWVCVWRGCVWDLGVLNVLTGVEHGKICHSMMVQSYTWKSAQNALNLSVSGENNHQFPLFYNIVRWHLLGFALLMGQIKTFEDLTLNWGSRFEPGTFPLLTTKLVYKDKQSALF